MEKGGISEFREVALWSDIESWKMYDHEESVLFYTMCYNTCVLIMWVLSNGKYTSANIPQLHVINIYNLH